VKKEELKPCPFCGNPGTQNFAESKDEVSCSDPECCTWPVHYFQWQQAVCWKQIETLQSRIESLGEVVKHQSEKLWKKGEAHTKEIRELMEAEQRVKRNENKNLIEELFESLVKIRNGYLAESGADFDWMEWFEKAEKIIKKAEKSL